jgi:hypothetical protein
VRGKRSVTVRQGDRNEGTKERNWRQECRKTGKQKDKKQLGRMTKIQKYRKTE